MKPINECKTVAELLESPERWTKGKAWGTANGQHAMGRDEATCFCVIGAIAYIYGDCPEGTVGKRSLLMRKKVEFEANTCYLASWNDAPERTHEEVLDVVRKAGI
jgi:hypothetical protein